jgi:hypothetical protein
MAWQWGRGHTGGRHEWWWGSVWRGGRGRARRFVRGALRINSQLGGGEGKRPGKPGRRRRDRPSGEQAAAAGGGRRC